MSKVHVFENTGENKYRCVIHIATATGTNNLVGATWKDIFLASGRAGSTILTVGTKLGNITQAEYDSIIAGDLLEIVAMIPLEGGAFAGPALNADVAAAVADWKTRTQNELRHYGQVIA